MPTNHKDNQGEDKPDNPASNRSKKPPTIRVNVNTGVEQIHEVNTQPKEYNGNENTVEVNVINPINNNLQGIRANEIAFDTYRVYKNSLYVNAGLFLGTLILAVIATCQYKSSQSAATIAQRTLDTSRKYDSISLVKQDELREDNERYNETNSSAQQAASEIADNNSKNALNAQIASLKETQRQFNIINKSYIQVSQFDTIKINGYNQIYKYEITNIGNQPAKIINANSYVFFTQKVMSYKDLQDYIISQHVAPQKEDDNSYVIKGSSITKSVNSYLDITNDIDKLVKSGVCRIYVMGELKYKNLVTDKLYIYKFATVYNFGVGVGYKMIYNENSN
ncbi:MAG: hypothetical protein JWR12_1898 [Mucilaginibacter sp.]|nr:hypothetical protein [Mucilaginibacter sp.]